MYLKLKAVSGIVFLSNYKQALTMVFRACYVGMPLYICGFITLGASFQEHLSVGALVMGWGISVLSVLINTVAVYAYCNDCFPKHKVGHISISSRNLATEVSKGEISALINLARTLGGSRNHHVLQAFEERFF